LFRSYRQGDERSCHFKTMAESFVLPATSGVGWAPFESHTLDKIKFGVEAPASLVLNKLGVHACCSEAPFSNLRYVSSMDRGEPTV